MTNTEPEVHDFLYLLPRDDSLTHATCDPTCQLPPGHRCVFLERVGLTRPTVLPLKRTDSKTSVELFFFEGGRSFSKRTSFPASTGTAATGTTKFIIINIQLFLPSSLN